jgi:hypothetical protein
MTSELDRLIEADIADPTLSNWMDLVDPDEELDWEEWEDQAKYCNNLYLYWKTLTEDQRAAVDRFTGVVWDWEYSDFINHVTDQVQLNKECREYTAPLVEYEEKWDDENV